MQWNSAEFRLHGDGPGELALLSAGAVDSGDALVLSHNALPENRDLIVDVHRRTHTPRKTVQLHRLDLPGAVASSSLFVYRVLPAPGLAAAAPAAPIATVVPPRFEAAPSTY